MLQNRNSIISFAIQDVLREFPRLEKVVMKYCEPGHSTIQEVDAVHSTIERGLKHLDLFSPLHLLRKLLKVRKMRPFNVLQMTKSKFFDFQKAVKLFKYSLVPCSNVKQLEFCQDNAKTVWLKTFSLETCKWLLYHKNVLRLKSVPTLRLSVLLNILFRPNFINAVSQIQLSKLYILKFIPNQDQKYFETKIEQYYKAKKDLEASPSVQNSF